MAFTNFHSAHHPLCDQGTDICLLFKKKIHAIGISLWEEEWLAHTCYQNNRKWKLDQFLRSVCGSQLLGERVSETGGVLQDNPGPSLHDSAPSFSPADNLTTGSDSNTVNIPTVKNY